MAGIPQSRILGLTHDGIPTAVVSTFALERSKSWHKNISVRALKAWMNTLGSVRACTPSRSKTRHLSPDSSSVIASSQPFQASQMCSIVGERSKIAHLPVRQGRIYPVGRTQIVLPIRLGGDLMNENGVIAPNLPAQRSLTGTIHVVKKPATSIQHPGIRRGQVRVTQLPRARLAIPGHQMRLLRLRYLLIKTSAPQRYVLSLFTSHVFGVF